MRLDKVIRNMENRIAKSEGHRKLFATLLRLHGNQALKDYSKFKTLIDLCAPIIHVWRGCIKYVYPSFSSIFVPQDDLDKVKWLAMIMDEVHQRSQSSDNYRR